MKKGEGVYTTDKWRYRNKAAVLLSTMLLTAALLTGCGASSSTGKGAEQTPSAAPQVNYATDDIYMQEAETTAEESTGTVMGQPETDVPAGANRKLIKTVDMNVETEAYDVLFPKVQTRVGELGGYIENLSEQQENYGYKTNLRYVSITARIPEDKLESFMTEVAAASNVISRNERVEDVTLSYVDLESRKKTLVTERDRLLVLLEQAETVEDIITIEGRLSPGQL